MSIYPVRISEWYSDPNDDKWSTAYDVITTARCRACGAKPRWKGAWAHHSIAHGHGDIWCSRKCLNSRKIHKLDKRQKRSEDRRWGKLLDKFKAKVPDLLGVEILAQAQAVQVEDLSTELKVTRYAQVPIDLESLPVEMQFPFLKDDEQVRREVYGEFLSTKDMEGYHEGCSYLAANGYCNKCGRHVPSPVMQEAINKIKDRPFPKREEGFREKMGGWVCNSCDTFYHRAQYPNPPVKCERCE